MNHNEILEKISDITSDDFCYSMDIKAHDNVPFTQEEAKMMQKKIIEVYRLSHTVYCDACRVRMM